MHTETLEKIKVYIIKNDKEIKKTLIPIGKYRHFKGGEYLCIGDGYYKEDLIIYKSLYDSKKYITGTLWGRPINDFLGGKKIGANIRISRFKFVPTKTSSL